jgi:hypothetical protein
VTSPITATNASAVIALTPRIVITRRTRWLSRPVESAPLCAGRKFTPRSVDR